VDDSRYRAATTDENHVKTKILKHIVEMGNSVMYKKATAELQALKTKQPAYFSDMDLFQKTLVILESHHYRQQARHKILNLFSPTVMRRIILDEEMGESTESDTG
jgi:hypothetical protein